MVRAPFALEIQGVLLSPAYQQSQRLFFLSKLRLNNGQRQNESGVRRLVNRLMGFPGFDLFTSGTLLWNNRTNRLLVVILRGRKGRRAITITSDTIREMFRLIDWMMRLSQRFEKQFKIELEAYEEELHMPYVTSIERLAKEEGLQKGELIGQIKILQELLELTSPTAEELGQQDIAALSNLCQELRQRVRSRNGK